MATDAQRAHGAALMDLFLKHSGQVIYPPGDVRTGQEAADWNLTEQKLDAVFAAKLTVEFDCSDYSAYLLKLMGCWPWLSPGWTGSDLLAVGQMPHYTNAKLAKVMALCVWGTAPGHHMAPVRFPDPKGGNPTFYSHGENGIQVVTLAEETVRQGGRPHVFLSVAKL
jgi:hypothetical protein